MARYVTRRLLWAIPTVLVVTFLAFLTLRAVTDPIASYHRVNPRATAEMKGRIETPTKAPVVVMRS